MPVPARPKIYHIVHHDRLSSIIADGFLWSDETMVSRQGTGTTIGMGSIKQCRLQLPVICHPGLMVGQCVPFYFCPRSIMLYVIHRRNHQELAYRGGQEPIVHLEADLHQVVEWADSNKRRWAFSLSNAAAKYAEFRNDIDDLGEINWRAVAATDFRETDTKEGKQAEFLIERKFPWGLIERIGIHSKRYVQPVSQAMLRAPHRPTIEIRREWYY